MISTFGSFSMAKLGIRSSQQGLQITGNNITNINTNGYTRQRINQVSLYGSTADRFSVASDVRIGMGSLVTSVTQIRDPFLDIRYRNEASNLGFYDEKMGNLEELKSILDEVSKDGIHTSFENIRTQLQNLANNPTSDVNDRLVRSACQELVSLLNKYAADLNTQKDTALKGFDQNVDEVNKMLTQIRDLNKEIRKSQIHGDNALELLDRRNMLIDQLSEMTKIKVTYYDEKITDGITVDRVKIELDAPGQDPTNRPVLVDGEFANELEIRPLGPDGKPDITNQNDYEIHLKGLTNTKGETPALAAVQEQIDKLNQISKSIVDTNQELTGVHKQLTDWQAELAKNPNKWAEDLFTDAGKNEQQLNTLRDNLSKAREELKKKPGDPTAKQNFEKAQNNLAAFSRLSNQRKEIDRQQKRLDDKFNSQFDILKKQLGSQGLTATATKDPNTGAYTIEVSGGKPPITPQKLIDGADPTKPALKFDVTPATAPSTGYDMQLDGKPFKNVDNKALEAAANKMAVKQDQWHGALKADLEYLNGKGEFGNPPSQIRGIAYYQRSLDTLAQTFANTMNGLNQDPNNPGANKNLFESGDPKNTNITASNISISKGWRDGTVKITTTTASDAGSGDNSNVLNMIQALNNKKQQFIAVDHNGAQIMDNGQGRLLFTGSFEDMFTNMNSVLGSDMSSTATMLDNAAMSANDRAVARDNVSSVDLNEEGINLVQYQKSFQAACRVMTTLDEMLQSVLNIGVGG